MDNIEILLRRQAILDHKRRILGYEVLLHPSNALGLEHSVLSLALSQFGVEQVLSANLNFVHANASLLMSEAVLLLPAKHTVLQILPEVTIDDADLVSRCQVLKQLGFKLALEDYSPKPDYEPILDLLHYIKINIQEIPPEQLKPTIAQIRKHSDATLLAKNVEQEEDFESCLALGFRLFQGYFYVKPSLLKNRKAQSSQTAIMRIMGMLLSDANVSDLEPLFKDNPTLTLGLLRLVNSVGINGGKAKINSLRQAIVVLGQKQLLRWIQLLLYSNTDGSEGSSLLQHVTLRSRLIELVAQQIESPVEPIREQAFMAGMLSLADAVMQLPLTEVLAQLGLSSQINEAVLLRQGQLGVLLNLAQAIETADFVTTTQHLQGLGLAISDFTRLQLEAVQWTKDLGNI
jgi:c-di-GMP phosphodiesterase